MGDQANVWRYDRFEDLSKVKNVFHCFPLAQYDNFLLDQLERITAAVLNMYELESVNQGNTFQTHLCLEQQPSPKLKLQPFGKELMWDRVRGAKWKQFQATLDR